MRNLSSLVTVLTLTLWLGACNAPLTEDVSPSPEPEAPAAQADEPAVALDNRTECQISSSSDVELPDMPFELPTPPAEVSWREADRENLGVGYIGPVETAPTPDTPDYLLVGFANADWLKRVILPIYPAPDAEANDWMACGWLMLDAQSDAPEKTEMEPPLFYPGYSGFGWIVQAEQGDWLQLDEGMWVLRSHLQTSTLPLGYIRWADRYQAMMAEHATYAPDDPAADWGYLFLKTPGTTAQLRPSPDSQADSIAQIDDSASMLPLELQGDWMRVRVYTPGNFCIEDWQGEVKEGWIRWMDPTQGGNQMGEPYKGC
ncbi:MAG: hypothetical protein AAFR99_08465 [Cyanobacteria bacterium J06629_9]